MHTLHWSRKKNYTRFTSCHFTGGLGPVSFCRGMYTLRKHLPLWRNVEEGTIKATNENHNPNTTCRNICVNSDKFCRSRFDLIHHWKTPNSIREKNSLAFEILILSYQYRSGCILNIWWRLGIAGVILMWLLWQS